MIGTILIAAIGYGFVLTVGTLGFVGLFIDGSKHLPTGLALIALAFGVAMLTRWAVGL